MSDKSKYTIFEIIKPDMYTLTVMLMFYVKLLMKYGKASFLFSMAAILNIEKMAEASKSQVPSIKILK